MISQGIGVIAALTLTACAQLHMPDTTLQASNNEACNGVADFYAVSSQLSPESGQEMLQALRLNQAQDDNPCDQLRLSVLLSKPDTRFHDDAEAGRLLQDFLHDPDRAQHPDRGFALLLADNISERRQLQEELQRLEKAIEQEQTTSQQLAEKLKREHAAAEALQLKLEQLNSIERDINAKEQSVATPAADGKTDEPSQNTPD